MRAHHRKQASILVAGAICLCCGVGVQAADQPTPTPTPRPAGGKALNEMAKDTELKGAEKGKPIVITNENLADYAGKGSVTAPSSSNPPNRRPVRDPLSKVAPVSPSNSSDGNIDERRRFWQNKFKSQIDRVTSIRYQISLLDKEIPGLWRDFYAWDDPMYRDGVIKPKLDAATDRRAQLEEELVQAEAELSEIKNDARKEGAEPGWFRGIPVPTPPASTPTPGIVIY